MFYAIVYKRTFDEVVPHEIYSASEDNAEIKSIAWEEFLWCDVLNQVCPMCQAVQKATDRLKSSLMINYYT